MPSKNVKLSIGGVGIFLASIVGVHQSTDYIVDKIIYPYIEPKIDSTIANYLTDHPQGETGQMLGIIEDVTMMFSEEKEAFLRVIRSSHLMAWNHMPDTTIRGYHLKHQDGAYYTMYEGIVFEATYTGSDRKFYFVDGYNNRIECLKNPGPCCAGIHDH